MADSSSLAEAISALQRRYGAAAVRRGGDPVASDVWPSGLPVLDRLVGGGLPLGRIAVLAGQRATASGRLTLLQALLAVASRSGQVAYVDLPGSLDPGYLADLGADLPSCLVVRPPQGAAGPGLAMARTLVRAGVPWVGIAFAPGRSGAAAGWEHPLTALGEAAWSSRAVVCVSAPAPLPRPLAYASSLTLGCTPLGWQEAHGDVVGLRVRLDVLKSKVGAPGASSPALLRYPRPHAVGDVVGLPTLLPGHGADGEAARERQRLTALAG
jgi:recA bacterial DNA recombination protein